MKSTEISLRVFGAYMILVPALGLILMPAFILDLFGLRHGPDFWMFRLLGLLVGILGIYYFIITKHQLKPMYSWSVWLRLSAAAFMIILYLLKEVEAGILLFAAVDALSAVWTWWTLQQKVSSSASLGMKNERVRT